MMKIGLSGGMGQRPIRDVPVLFFDHRRETDAPRSVLAEAGQPREIKRRLQDIAIPARLHFDEGGTELACNMLPASVFAEPIRRPLRRRSEVELVIGGVCRLPDKRFEAGMPPQLIGA